MFASLAFLAAAAQLNQIVIPLRKPPPQIEQPIAPIETDGPLWAAACKDWDDWDKPAPPVRIHANTFLVGTCGISSILITGSQGDVLIDGGTEAGADLIADNIRKLGFRLARREDHPQEPRAFRPCRRDRAAAAADRRTGLSPRRWPHKVLATGVPAARTIRRPGCTSPSPPSRVDRVIGDGGEVRLDNILLTAIATPGHTPGALTWHWESCEGGVCRTIVYADSLTPVSRDDYRFSDHPAYLAAFRASIAKVAALDCEILLTPHPSASDMPRPARARATAREPHRLPRLCGGADAGNSTNGWRRKPRQK